MTALALANTMKQRYAWAKRWDFGVRQCRFAMRYNKVSIRCTMFGLFGLHAGRHAND